MSARPEGLDGLPPTVLLAQLSGAVTRGDMHHARALRDAVSEEGLDEAQRAEYDRLSGLLRPDPLASALTALVAGMLGVIAGLLFL